MERPYYTDQPKPDEVQCARAWYTGAFADRERQLGVEILLGALLSTNSSPLKAALLAEQLGADIDIGFDDSTLQPTLEPVSYTHLDVYKRQPSKSIISSAARAASALAGSKKPSL